MRPVPSGLQDQTLAAFLTELQMAVQQLQQPGAPVTAFACTFAKLPPAESYKACSVLVSDRNCMAISTLVGSAWTWLRSDGSAI